MDTAVRIATLETKIQILQNRQKDNANVIRKYERELRKLKGIPKLEVEWKYATNVPKFDDTTTAKKKK